MFDIGRFCVKIAGRDAGKKCIVIDRIDNTYVLVDGETRRRKCNIKHLEPLDKVVDVTRNAPHTEIVRIFKEMGLELKETKPRQKAERPVRIRKKKIDEEKTIPEKQDVKGGKKKAKTEA